MVRAVVAAPLHNGEQYVVLAVRSLQMQTYRDYALLLVDDASADSTPELAAQLADADDRTHFYRNCHRLGMVANWRRCVALARELYPEARYFAWGSDHDLWEPGWLEALVALLDANPRVVLAYPLNDRIDDAGEVVRKPSRFETVGVENAAERVLAGTRGMGAGSIVYGLYRIDALLSAGVFRRVLAPDRLVLTELAFQGQFAQVEDVLWHRRFVGLVSRDRQRVSLFAGGAPWYTRLPPNLCHAGALLGLYAVRGTGKPEIGRLRGLSLTWVYSRGALTYSGRRRWGRVARRARRLKKHRLKGTRGKRRDPARIY